MFKIFSRHDSSNLVLGLSLISCFFLINCGSIRWANGWKSIPYEYNKANGDYVGVAGDFDLAQLIDDEHLRFLCRYYKDSKRGGLEVQVGIKLGSGSGVVLNKSTVSVESSNLGPLEFEGISKSYNHQYAIFFKEVNATTAEEIRAKLKDDRIAISIYQKTYEFVFPNEN